MDAAISHAFCGLRRSVQKNLSVLTVSFLRVQGAARSGYGRLSLGALFRVLPTLGTPHAREKRLHRFLANLRIPLIVSAGSGIVITDSSDREHSVGAKRR